MGGCFSTVVFFFDSNTSKSSSSDNDDNDKEEGSARVISVNGVLREYPIPFTVSQLVQTMAIRESDGDNSKSDDDFFVCSSDSLCYDDYIPALDNHEVLQPNQIYFVFPKTKLQYRLSASDMAALAVKATLALQNSSSSSKINNNNKNKKKLTRISPVVLVKDQHHQQHELQHVNATKSSSISRSGSIRKLQRYSSKRAKMAVRSFRLRLTTIYEGHIL